MRASDDYGMGSSQKGSISGVDESRGAQGFGSGEGNNLERTESDKIATKTDVKKSAK